MTKISINLRGSVLVIEQEMIPVRTMVEPDPGWRRTDSQGHDHYAVETNAGITYPTLELKSGPATWCSECRDEHFDSWWQCRQCEVKIRPGTRTGRTHMIRGMTDYLIDDVPVTPEVARQFVTQWQRELNERANHDPSMVAGDMRRSEWIKSQIVGGSGA